MHTSSHCQLDRHAWHKRRNRTRIALEWFHCSRSPTKPHGIRFCRMKPTRGSRSILERFGWVWKPSWTLISCCKEPVASYTFITVQSSPRYNYRIKSPLEATDRVGFGRCRSEIIDDIRNCMMIIISRNACNWNLTTMPPAQQIDAIQRVATCKCHG